MAMPGQGRTNEGGFTIPVVATSLTVMLGILGLAEDMGRMFVIRSELQAFSDAAALAAVVQMDGTRTGIQAANTLAGSGPGAGTTGNAVNFSTQTVANVSVGYGAAFNGTYDAYATAVGPASNTYRFVRVTATAAVTMYFLGVLPGIATTQTLSATATAGQLPGSSVTSGGLEPFIPDAHDITDHKNFGFTPDQRYTLKWGSGNGNGKENGNGNWTNCPGDSGFSPPENSPSAHGFVDVGQGSGSSQLNQAIEYGGYPNASSTPASVSPGTVLISNPGNHGASAVQALSVRSAQDSDQTSTSWEAYKSASIGNYRRVVTVPVGDPASWSDNGANAGVTVIGFANFLLDPANTISGSSGPICATYIGPGNLTGVGAGGTDGSSVYTNRLYQ